MTLAGRKGSRRQRAEREDNGTRPFCTLQVKAFAAKTGEGNFPGEVGFIRNLVKGHTLAAGSRHDPGVLLTPETAGSQVTPALARCPQTTGSKVRGDFYIASGGV